jgi:hypothetical protein
LGIEGQTWRTWVWIGESTEAEHQGNPIQGGFDVVCTDGTVEYVGLILLVSVLMVGIVAAMKGFNNKRPLGRLPAQG